MKKIFFFLFVLFFFSCKTINHEYIVGMHIPSGAKLVLLSDKQLNAETLYLFRNLQAHLINKGFEVKVSQEIQVSSDRAAASNGNDEKYLSNLEERLEYFRKAGITHVVLVCIDGKDNDLYSLVAFRLADSSIKGTVQIELSKATKTYFQADVNSRSVLKRKADELNTAFDRLISSSDNGLGNTINDFQPSVTQTAPIIKVLPLPGKYQGGLKIGFQLDREGDIYFTTDGTTPNSSSRKLHFVAEPINMSTKKSVSLKAYAVGTDGSASSVQSFDYVVEP